MANTKSNNSSWSFSALTLLFIGLKLTNYIAWSWWWVLAPAWLPVTAVIVGFVLYLLIDMAYKSTKSQKQKDSEELVSLFKEYGKRYSKTDARNN